MSIREQLATALSSWLTDPAQGNGLLERLVPVVSSIVAEAVNAENVRLQTLAGCIDTIDAICDEAEPHDMRPSIERAYAAGAAAEREACAAMVDEYDGGGDCLCYSYAAEQIRARSGGETR